MTYNIKNERDRCRRIVIQEFQRSIKPETPTAETTIEAVTARILDRIATDQMRFIPLTDSQQILLNSAVHSVSGNPWERISIRARRGGTKKRMFERMQHEHGWFDEDGRITDAGRDAAAAGGYWNA